MVIASIKPGMSPCLTIMLRFPGGIEMTVPLALKVSGGFWEGSGMGCPAKVFSFCPRSFSALQASISIKLTASNNKTGTYFMAGK